MPVGALSKRTNCEENFQSLTFDQALKWLGNIGDQATNLPRGGATSRRY
jgi:hypothetical protein